MLEAETETVYVYTQFDNVCIYFKAGYRAVLEMTKTSNTLPNEDHFHYYSSYPAFEDAMAKQGNQCLRRYVNMLFIVLVLLYQISCLHNHFLFIIAYQM